MVSLDLVLVVILLLCFILGVLGGFLLQVVALAALLIGLGAGWIVTFLLGVLFPSGVLSAPFLSAVIGTVVFILFYVITRRRGKELIHAKALAFSKGFADRVLGGMFSLVKGMIIILLVVWFLDCIEAEWRGVHPRAGALWGESHGVRWARRHNMIAGLTPMRRLKGLFVSARDPGARSTLQGEPAYERMLMNERLRALSGDVEIAEAMSRRDLISVLGDNRVRALLADETFWRDFSSVRWEMALEKQKTPIEVSSPGLTPRQAPVPVSPETRTENRMRLGPPGLSRVVLKTGAVLHGAITKENPEGITIDVFVNGGVITMSVPRREIERMESTDSTRTR